MKVSYNWLGQYISHKKPVEAIAGVLTNTGLEVEEVAYFTTTPPHLKNVIVGYVEHLEAHPDADKLVVTKVDTGANESSQIICGAPNVAKGQKVPVAQVGTKLTNVYGEEVKIKKAKIRGVESKGMICSEDELGLSADQSGILVLDEQAEIGKPLSALFSQYEDHVFEIGLTPNRTDAMGHIGVARDIAAVLDLDLTYPSVEDINTNHSDQKAASVIIENSQDCPRYSGIVLNDLKIEDSPKWLQNKLKAIGLNPANNVVDVTNYVLMETGHPLHAFDWDKIDEQQVYTGRSQPGDQFTTLDGHQHELDGKELMIWDSKKPIAMAGIMGGANSGVDANTTTIFLESACFDSVTIRKAANHHQIMTDASFRFERGADPNITVYALKRAVQLLKSISGATIASSLYDEYPNVSMEQEVFLNLEYVRKLLGESIPRSEVIRILKRLEFKIEDQTEDTLKLRVPTFRADVYRPVDVVEELIRIYSLNSIEPGHKLNAPINNHPEKKREHFLYRIGQYLCDNGFYEMVSQPFGDQDQVKQYMPSLSDCLVPIYNPLSKQENCMHADLLFTGLRSVEYNLNRGNGNLRLFEMGRTYQKFNKNIQESPVLGLWIAGDFNAPHWYSNSQKMDFYYLKGIIYNLLNLAGMAKFEETAIEEHDYFETGLTFNALNGEQIGQIGTVDTALLKASGIKETVFYAQMNLLPIIRNYEQFIPQFSSISKYPAITRDLSMILEPEVKFKQIKNCIYAVEHQGLLQDVWVFDVYKGEKLEEGKKSYAVRLMFRDESKTLKDETVDEIMEAVIKNLQKEINLEIRK